MNNNKYEKSFIIPISKDDLVDRLKKVDFNLFNQRTNSKSNSSNLIFGSQLQLEEYVDDNIDKYIYTLDKFYTQPCFKKYPDNLLRVNTVKLYNVIGSRNKKILKHLQLADVLVKVKNYSKGKESNGFQTFEFGFNEVVVTDDRKNSWLSKIETNKVNQDFEIEKKLFQTLKNISIDASNLNIKERIFWMKSKTNLFIKFNPQIARLYYNFVNFPSEMRKKVKLNGNSIRFIDFTNSQPVFFIQVAKYILKEYNQPIAPKTEKFFNLIEKGKLYEFICSRFNCNRDHAKELVMVLFFGKINGVIQNYFKKNFKQIHSVIQKFKENQKEDESNKLSIALTNKESELIFTICNRLEFDFLTVHDSIYVEENYFDRLIEVTKEVLNEKGITCTININDERKVLIKSILSPATLLNKINGTNIVEPLVNTVKAKKMPDTGKIKESFLDGLSGFSIFDMDEDDEEEYD